MPYDELWCEWTSPIVHIADWPEQWISYCVYPYNKSGFDYYLAEANWNGEWPCYTTSAN